MIVMTYLMKTLFPSKFNESIESFCRAMAMRMNTKKAKKVTGKVKEGQIQICHGKKFSMKLLPGRFLQYFPKNYEKTPILCDSTMVKDIKITLKQKHQKH